MPTTGIDKLPYPNSGDIPDGPAAFLALSQRLSRMKGAGVGYVADSAALGALITNGDAFTGLSVYHAAAAVVVRFNGTAFKIAEVKRFADVSEQGSWTTSYSGLLEADSFSWVSGKGEYVYSGSDWGFVPVADTGWLAPTLLNSWVNYGAPYASAGYRSRSGEVALRGVIKSGTAARYTILFTLPVGFRPSATARLVTVSGVVFALVEVAANGEVSIASTGADNGSLSLDGIRFMAV